MIDRKRDAKALLGCMVGLMGCSQIIVVFLKLEVFEVDVLRV